MNAISESSPRFHFYSLLHVNRKSSFHPALTITPSNTSILAISERTPTDSRSGSASSLHDLK
ncbi:hypothetical protein E2C01_003526 [Portunus trituberculatus]|uniref:Uncharacterized protein n=1 Tax=Portunus trituberculatus TaxID=210409 RepID=A0A5B7CME7_PORTR|nr:hypothetical protein [Portunus trituberculatus]